MPLEIRELVIKVEINETTLKRGDDEKVRYEQLKTDIINECVKKIESKVENLFGR
jgi:hypothetical protein